jgi:hypothetical protein
MGHHNCASVKHAAFGSLRLIGALALSFVVTLAINTPLHAQAACPFNTRTNDATDRASPTVDGQLFARFARGMRDAALVGRLSRSVPAPDADSVVEHIEGNVTALDIDGDGEFTTIDGLVIARYLSGFRGTALTSGLPTMAANASRKTSAAISDFIAKGCVADAPLLPIEVIGPDGYTETISVSVGNASDINRLWLQCHRCGWRDGSIQAGRNRGAKGSVRVNGGSWIDLTDDVATVSEPEKAYGGISGGFFTTRFTVPVGGVVKGKNTIEFRFNKTDGHTSGYRILNVNFLRSDGQRALGKYATLQDDPTKWKPQPSSTTNPQINVDIAAGRALWNGSVPLRESPLSPKILKASCASCHAADGRDLKYFNYSDWSIGQRAEFHGLTTKQGKQLAAYIRNLNVLAPKQAAPWNPPYQPGPGLDDKPVLEWSAGAGLAAVLEHDQESLKYLFPNADGSAADLSVASIAETINIKKTLNVREIPVAVQLPDWNEWLATEHPAELWDSARVQPLLDSYTTARNALVSGGAAILIAEKKLDAMMETFRDAVNEFQGLGGPQPCPRFYSGDIASPAKRATMEALPTDKTCEDGMQAINRWFSVKMWELNNQFVLEEAPAQTYRYGEARGWVGATHQVFWAAAHRSSDDSQKFRYQSVALGKFHSMTWYHVQMVVNAGHRANSRFVPQDWFYTPNHIMEASVKNGTANKRPPIASIAIMSQLKMYQNLDRTGPDGLGTDKQSEWWLPFVTPRMIESYADSGAILGQPWVALDDYESGLRAKVTNEFLRVFLKKQKTYPISSLPRRSNPGPNGDDDYEDIDYVPTAYTGGGCYYTCPGQARHADNIYRLIPRLKALGVDSALVNELIDWSKAVWPAGTWDSLR